MITIKITNIWWSFMSFLLRSIYVAFNINAAGIFNRKVAILLFKSTNQDQRFRCQTRILTVEPKCVWMFGSFLLILKPMFIQTPSFIPNSWSESTWLTKTQQFWKREIMFVYMNNFTHSLSTSWLTSAKKKKKKLNLVFGSF